MPSSKLDNRHERVKLTAADLKKWRRVTPEETETFRRAIAEKLGVSRPRRMGRPPKEPQERYVPISWRTPPQVIDWLAAQAHNVGIERYQTFLSMLMKWLMQFEVVKDKDGFDLRLPRKEAHSSVREKPIKYHARPKK